ncbi:hypothetical protein [Teichococcus aestuarii]|uniref:hypothetical protein n=1 Tax=Teichococcus aestuarii TaxID=568898 RepID=UPI0036238030
MLARYPSGMGNAKTAAEILLDTLAARGADRAFCVPGNPTSRCSMRCTRTPPSTS